MFRFNFYKKHPSVGEKLPKDLGELLCIGRKVKNNRKPEAYITGSRGLNCYYCSQASR